VRVRGYDSMHGPLRDAYQQVWQLSAVLDDVSWRWSVMRGWRHSQCVRVRGSVSVHRPLRDAYRQVWELSAMLDDMFWCWRIMRGWRHSQRVRVHVKFFFSVHRSRLWFSQRPVRHPSVLRYLPHRKELYCRWSVSLQLGNLRLWCRRLHQCNRQRLEPLWQLCQRLRVG